MCVHEHQARREGESAEQPESVTPTSLALVARGVVHGGITRDETPKREWAKPPASREEVALGALQQTWRIEHRAQRS